ncbi:MAG: hypothetical protein LBV13_01580 [Methanomassiliicoccaceae archaeon]|nr:hypothetical protein [Methanomassiliicoccaceae archaeon]
MRSKNDTEVFELLCYYLAKEDGAVSFSVKKMGQVYEDARISMPDKTSLKKDVLRCGSFRPFGIEGTLKFSKDGFRSLDKAYGHFWGAADVKKETTGAVVRGGTVRLTDFADICRMTKNTEAENFELLCYYLTKERSEKAFSARVMMDVYEDAGLARPDRPSFEKLVKKHGSFKPIGIEGTLAFKPEAFGPLDSRYGHLWANSITPAARPGSVPEGVGILDETKFCGRRDGFDKLIGQINSAYRDGSFDSCAVVMRRLLEACLVLSFRSNGMENEISFNGRYLCLGDIVKKVIEKNAFGLSEKDLRDASGIGDYSGHGPTYNFSANDINSARTAYRNVLDMLFRASKII